MRFTGGEPIQSAWAVFLASLVWETLDFTGIG